MKNLTANAELVHLEQFAKKLALHIMLEQDISVVRGRTAQVSVADAVMMLAMGVLAGAKHMSHLALIRTDAVIRDLFRWNTFPDDTTFSRITLNLDSTVKGVYGSQQGAKKGFNTIKKGKKSYHPLLCFIAETRECLHNWFRSGSAYTGNGAVEFMKECFSQIPKRAWNILVRADSGFFNGDLLELLEEKGSQYLIKVKMKNLAPLLMGQSLVLLLRDQSLLAPGRYTHTTKRGQPVRIGSSDARIRWPQEAFSPRISGPTQRSFRPRSWHTIFWSGVEAFKNLSFQRAVAKVRAFHCLTQLCLTNPSRG